MGIDNKAFSIIHRSAVALLKRCSMMYLLPFALPMMIVSCEEAVEHTAPAIYDRDSVALMISYGVNTLISDSGVMKYRIVTEEWEINQNRNPSRWIFRQELPRGGLSAGRYRLLLRREATMGVARKGKREDERRLAIQ